MTGFTPIDGPKVDVEAILRRLTAAQKEAIAHPEADQSFWSAHLGTAKSVERKGLCGPLTLHNGGEWTPLGRQVRQALLAKAEGRS